MTYTLGVDLGTTYSAAAVARDGRVEVCTLGTTAPAIPSVVVLRPDGEVLVGEAADRRSLSEPSRTAREFKRRLGDPTPIVLGGTPYGAESLMAHLLKVIVAQVTEREGDEPARIVLTHPANYGQYKLGLMQEAARLAGLDLHRVHYVSEPQAAAVSYAQSQRVEAGEMVAVYDFGGGTFDAAVVRRTDQGFELMGTPEGMDRLGGIDVDAAVLAHVNTTVDGMLSDLDTSDPSTRSALSRLRDECREAKEALSTDTDTTIPVSIPGLQTEVRLTREELEGMIRPRLNETVDALVRAVSSAGLTMDQVSRILLVGGTSRIPLVGQLVREATGRPIAVDAHPKLAIASGAALLGEAAEAAGAAAPVAGVAPPEPSPPVATPGPPPSATAAGRPAAKGGRKVAALV
ncbi:MAG TPA: Hsp70 family protein, partial [Acidimicrobiales bacterium]